MPSMTVDYNTDRLIEAVDSFPQVRILVIGDVMLDAFLWGKVERISPEAPVPVVDVDSETRLLGGAANTINNIISAGGRASLSGVVGGDGPAEEIFRLLKDLDVDVRGLLVDRDRPTTIKTRVVAHAQQVVRFDREKRKPLGPEMLKALTSFMADAAGQVDGVIVSDYGKGVVTRELMDEVRRVFGRAGRFVAVDPKVNNFRLYEKVSVITPNHHEAALGSGVTVESYESLVEAGEKLLDDLSCEAVLITRGEQGMTLFQGGHPPANIPTVARKVYDVTGAGDTVIAILTLGAAAGLSLMEASVLANFAAGIVVGQVGTSTVTAEDLKERVRAGASGFNGRKG